MTLLQTLKISLGRSFIDYLSSLKQYLRDRTLFPNSTSLGRPLIPDEMPLITLQNREPPGEEIPAGQLGHHYLATIAKFWLQDDNSPIRHEVSCRDTDFPNVLSELTPSIEDLRLTPLNVAWGFHQVAHAIFYNNLWHATKFYWKLDGSIFAGLETRLSPQLLSTALAGGGVNIQGNNSLDTPEARTRFTGQKLDAQRIMLNFWGILNDIWQRFDKEPIGITMRPGKTMSNDVVGGPVTQRFIIQILDVGTPFEPVRWRDFSSRLLRMLQFPAYLERWETLSSDWYIGDKKFATAYIVVYIEGEESTENAISIV